jgi:hypothetical protein
MFRLLPKNVRIKELLPEYNFTSCSARVWNMALRINERMYTEGVREQDAEESMWA